MEKFKKILSVIERNLIKQIAHFHSNYYTKCYTKYLKKIGVDIEGLPRYIATTAVFDGVDYSKIHIGNDTVISSDVLILTHDYSIARGLQAIGKNNPNPSKDELFLKDIYIGRNCFIGARSMLLPGTTIGNNVIIGAGSVVKGNIPDFSIVVGNPAHKIADVREWAERKIELGEYFVER